MLLSTTALLELVDQGVIRNVQEGAVNASSIDLHLGRDFLVEVSTERQSPIDLARRESPPMATLHGSLVLDPGDFCLASSVELFNLPNDISGMFLLKSSLARAGLEHSQAGWCDAGWNGSALTLELRNNLKYNSLLLTAGMAIGQLVFFRHEPVPPEFSYRARGRYNGDTTVKGMKK